MSAETRTHANTASTAAAPVRSGLTIQRKCSCGGSAGLTGKCDDCEKKKLAAGALQKKLTVNEPGDAYEQEADRVAEQVMRMPAPVGAVSQSSAPFISRAANGGGGGAEAPGIVHDVLRSSGQPLDAGTRAFMEPRFGHDFSGVRVHTDARAAESARAVNALAYTVGNNVVFGDGQYAPGSGSGQRLLAHELTHTIQQLNGVQVKPAINQPSGQYEQGADRAVLGIMRSGVSPISGQVRTGVVRQLMRQSKVSKSESDSNTKKNEGRPQQTGARNVDKDGNSDEAVHWWAPFGERVAKWGFGGVVTYINIDKKTMAKYASHWVRNALDAAIFAVGTGVVTEVVLKRLKLAEIASKAMGIGVAFGLGYEGLDVRERIRCETVDAYSWYGRYRYNYANNAILAVEYWGKGATKRYIVSPVYFEQAIVDANENVLFVYVNKLSYYGIHLNGSPALPLFNYGRVS